MTDITIILASTESSLLDVSRQAQTLAAGLQNAAPGNTSNVPNKSVLYLLEVSDHLVEDASKCKKLINASLKEQHEKLAELMGKAVARDMELREKHGIADKFRFVRDRLNELKTVVDDYLKEISKEVVKTKETLSEDEVMVYVYLFNAQGITLQTWQKMVNPSILYEHSVNRPIYTIKEHIESFINRKTNKVQHGYLTITINKKDILIPENPDTLKDIYGNPVIKVHEGSLDFKRLIAFSHNGLDYIVDDEGALVKKMD